MTSERRKEIFAKDYLTISDLQELLGLSYQMAARKMREIKFKYDRLKIQGRCMVEDYRQYYNLPIEYVIGCSEN